MPQKRIRRVTVTLRVRGQKPVKREWRAGRRKVFTPAGVEEILREVVEGAEKQGLGGVLKLVQVGPAEFNLVSRAQEAI